MKEGVIVFFYVDDIVVMHPKEKTEVWRQFHIALTTTIEVKELGELSWFLGVEVIRNRETREMWLSQEGHIAQLAHKFHRDSTVEGHSTPYAQG
jgi:hypothetical protein